MKRTPIKSICLNRPDRKPMIQYESLGSKIRKGIYDGIGEESQLLRGVYDDVQGDVDHLFQFRDSTVGVDKFDRAIIFKRNLDNLRSTSSMGAAASSNEPAASPSSLPVTPNNNSVQTE